MHFVRGPFPVSKSLLNHFVMNRFLLRVYHSFIIVSLVLCIPPANGQKSNDDKGKGLKDYYKDFFSIGVAVSPRSLRTDEAQLIIEQFNSMTAENAMKMGPIHPQENKYNWAGADS